MSDEFSNLKRDLDAGILNARADLHGRERTPWTKRHSAFALNTKKDGL